MNRIELLAPAGDFESLQGAIANGANAIYLGTTAFSARAFAKNFNLEELDQAIQYAHLRNVRIFVTVNTLYQDDEMKDVLSLIDSLYELQIDALLIQDIGLLKLVHERYPDMELHTSTQMSVMSLEALRYFEDLGVKRVVLARENTIDEIKYICSHTDLEIEVFAHGALCVAYSGQCLMSSMIGRRSGNRGACAQPCRLPYSLEEDGKVIDDLTDRVGFREVRTQGKDILLNGKKLQIKGFYRHEDHPQFGCALPLSAIMQDLQLARDMGANSIRTSHYPNDELFLDLCDELGILVWEENHARGLSEEQMKNPTFERQCEACIREMIAAHYNHPSIYIWGILNECASDTEYGRECYKTQLELIKSLDVTRPRSFSSCRFKTDICFDLVDVVSYNIYPKWYHNTPVAEYLDDLYKWVQTTGGAGKPFLITEVGAGAIYGYRTPAKVKWSEEYQVLALEEQLGAILSYKDCSGVYIWQFCDVRVTNDWWNTRPRTMNNKGIVDEYRRPKLSYETVKRIFGSVDTYRK